MLNLALTRCVKATTRRRKTLGLDMLAIIFWGVLFAWQLFGTQFILNVDSNSFQDPLLPNYCPTFAYSYARALVNLGKNDEKMFNGKF